MRTLAILVGVCVATTTLAADVRPEWKLIGNPKHAAATLDRAFVRNAFLRKETAWGDGETIRPIDLPMKLPQRDQFTREVLKKTPAQLKSYWSQQIFSGKGVPPPEAESPNDVITYVLAHPGALGYVPADVDPHGARVIEVR